MAKKPKWLSPDEPLRHPDHPRPVTRREFIRQGFISGPAAVMGSSALLGMLLNPKLAHAALDADITQWATDAGCPVNVQGNGKIPVICFDLAGGANLAGSNVLVGGPLGQLDSLSTAGYNKLGIPSDRLPLPGSAFVDTSLGLAFNSESAMLAGIKKTFTSIGATTGGVNGFVIPAVSDNDTNINPHNPMYGLAKAGVDTTNNLNTPGYGAKGKLLSLIGSVASVSGGRSMSPTILIDPSIQPTKISRPSDDLALVDTGSLSSMLNSQSDVVNVMQTIARISHDTITNANARGQGKAINPGIQDTLNCAYFKAADTADRFGDPTALDPTVQAIQNIFAPAGGLNSSSEFLKTASIMKLVVEGYAGAGTITMGGYDYHTGDRKTGELRDLRAGYCIGACLQYAALMGMPLMVYVFSDGSLFSNGNIDSNQTISDGIVSLPPGKGVWTGDNSSTACTFALVYDPSAAPTVATNNQIGFFQPSGSVATNATVGANNIKVTAARDVNSLVYTLLLNYMALHGQSKFFETVFPNHTLGTTGVDNLNNLVALNQINSVVNGKIVPA